MQFLWNTRIAISLSRLGTGNGQLLIGDLYGVAKSTVSIIVREFCKAVRQHLQRDQNREAPAAAADAVLGGGGHRLAAKAKAFYGLIIRPTYNHIQSTFKAPLFFGADLGIFPSSFFTSKISFPLEKSPHGIWVPISSSSLSLRGSLLKGGEERERDIY
jgi:hypothetical protein